MFRYRLNTFRTISEHVLKVVRTCFPLTEQTNEHTGLNSPGVYPVVRSVVNLKILYVQEEL